MNFLRLRYLVFILVFMTLASSCTSKKNVTGDTKIKKKSTKELIELLTNAQTSTEWLKTKASVDLRFNEENHSLKSNVRMRSDSATWISLTKPPIPLFSALISHDSLKFLIKVGDKQFYKNHFDSINEILNAEVDYSLLEDFFKGNAIAFDESSDFKNEIDNNAYLLSSEKSKKIEKLLKKGKIKDDEYIYQVWIHPEHFKCKAVSIIFPSKNTEINVKYDDWEMTDNVLFPMKSHLTLTTSLDTIEVKMDYSRIIVNEPTSMPFKISDSYTPFIVPE